MHVLAVDGGGTRTTIALADGDGRELVRRTGPAGIVDPRWPLAAAEAVVGLARSVLDAAGVVPPVEVLCAGLAGSGDASSREIVRRGLISAGLARRVVVCSDGEIALEGALMGGAGVLLVAGTGSIAWGRGEDGRVARCGGWGRIVGDEGSAYWLGREALRAVLRAADGRGEDTTLRSRVIGPGRVVAAAEAISGWTARATKAQIAALARDVVEAAAEGDGVARRLLRDAAAALAEHATTLARRLAPWSGAVPVVLHGGLAGESAFSTLVVDLLSRARGWDGGALEIRDPLTDPVTGAIRLALRS